MSTKAPSFQFYASDYLADLDVQLMTLEEEGAYIRLLAYCWREGSIPNNDALLSRLCKGGSTTIIAVVKQRFEPSGDGATLRHKRLDQEREKQEAWREKSAAGGRLSAESRARSRRKAMKENALNSGKGGSTTVQAVVEECLKPNGNSSTSYSTSLLIPPNPQGGMDEVDFTEIEKPTESASSISSKSISESQRVRVSAIFGRKPETPWSEKETKAFRKIRPMDEEDLAVVESYYAANRKLPVNYCRRDILTLLNNFQSEVDKSRLWQQTKHHAHQPSNPKSAANNNLNAAAVSEY